MAHLSTIGLEGIRLKAFHGCYPEEAVVGNEYIVDLYITADTSLAEATDNVEDSVNYQEAYAIVCRAMSERSHILEHVVRRIVDGVFAQFPQAIGLRLKVRKLAPAMGGVVYASSVEVERMRDGYLQEQKKAGSSAEGGVLLA